MCWKTATCTPCPALLAHSVLYHLQILCAETLFTHLMAGGASGSDALIIVVIAIIATVAAVPLALAFDIK